MQLFCCTPKQPQVGGLNSPFVHFIMDRMNSPFHHGQ